MRKLIITLCLLLWYNINDVQTALLSNSSTPPPARTGAPGETTCGACHSGGAGLPNFVIRINSSITLTPGDTFIYSPDSTYTLEVELIDVGARNGFEITIINQAGSTAGTFSLLDPATTSLLSATVNNQPRTYVGHKNASNINIWTFLWKAPPYTEDLTAYLVVNKANGDGTFNGDAVNSGVFYLLPDTYITDTITAITDFNHPNPELECGLVYTLEGIFIAQTCKSQLIRICRTLSNKPLIFVSHAGKSNLFMCTHHQQ